MQRDEKVRDMFLQEINTLKKKIEEIEGLVGRNGVRTEDLIKRATNVANNFKKKIEVIKKMASKK